MPQILNPADVATRLKLGETREQIFLDDAGRVKAKMAGITASIEVPDGAADDRAIDFVISTGALDRYNSTIAPKGWQLESFNANPVVLWAHDDSIPAIGRAEETRVDGVLRSRAIFADRDIHPLADTVYRLIKGKFINAASVGWIPLKWQYVEEEGRGFGVDYLEQELLEWSVVNIPANPGCLVDARSIGIDTRPLLVWAERTLDRGGMLMIPRTELEELRKAAGAPTMGRPIRGAAAESEQSFTDAAAAAATLLKAGAITTDEFTAMLIRLAPKALARSGRVLSAENEDTLRQAHDHCMRALDHCKQACEHVMSVVDQNRDPEDGDGNDDPDDPNNPDDTENPDDPNDDDPQEASAEIEQRQRRVRLLKLSASPLAIAAAQGA